MAAEIISWPNLYERHAAGPEDPTHDLLNTSWTAHPTDLVGPIHICCFQEKIQGVQIFGTDSDLL